ncbi:site-specific tyrosine recombinase/integron integrase [Clostridium tetani]|uniref:site-specific tyrosine recombinase/integron integrase n=1 Tax=Clostridium tetani TaxID=1513 RepID=UPI00102771F8|nr:site-specific tyrosine recombinase/integron integrase [Clostridium tetani]RXI70526.1 integrase [Clostridium tetani]
MNCNEEVTIKLIGKISLRYPELNQLGIRNIIDEVLVNYDVQPIEKSLVVSDIEEKIQYYLASKKLDGLSEKTLYNYNLHLMRFANFIHKPINSITVIDLRLYFAMLNKEKNLKNTTMGSEISIMKSFFSWLEDEDLISKNPMRKIKNLKKEKRLRKSLTQEELELLRDSCKTVRQRALLEFLFSTGCRVSEIYNTNIEDIDWNKEELNVIGKGNKERTVFINAKAKLYLKKYLKERKHIITPALFVVNKKPYKRLGVRSIQREINKIGKQAGFDKSIFPHLLRHTTATLALKSGMSLTSIQQILGHDDPSTTQIYAETNKENVKQEYRKYLIQ